MILKKQHTFSLRIVLRSIPVGVRVSNSLPFSDTSESVHTPLQEARPQGCKMTWEIIYSRRSRISKWILTASQRRGNRVLRTWRCSILYISSSNAVSFISLPDGETQHWNPPHVWNPSKTASLLLNDSRLSKAWTELRYKAHSPHRACRQLKEKQHGENPKPTACKTRLWPAHRFQSPETTKGIVLIEFP